MPQPAHVKSDFVRHKFSILHLIFNVIPALLLACKSEE